MLSNNWSGVNSQVYLHDTALQTLLNICIPDESVDVSTVPDDGPVTVTTDKGTEIDADIVFKTVGLPVQSEAYRNSLGEVYFRAIINCIGFDSPKNLKDVFEHKDRLCKVDCHRPVEKQGNV